MENRDLYSFYRENGQEVHYAVDASFLMDAMAVPEYVGLSGAANADLECFWYPAPRPAKDHPEAKCWARKGSPCRTSI
jgi:hypothetical protein